MKRGNLKRRIGSLALAAAMAVTSFPAPGREVHAAEAPEPSKFATVEQLKDFNTDDTDSKRNTAKLYLGNNEQTWWIVGTQGGNSVTLVAANSLRDNNISSLTLMETKNGRNPACSKGCGHFFHGIDMCYFSFRLFLCS